MSLPTVSPTVLSVLHDGTSYDVLGWRSSQDGVLYLAFGSFCIFLSEIAGLGEDEEFFARMIRYWCQGTELTEQGYELRDVSMVPIAAWPDFN